MKANKAILITAGGLIVIGAVIVAAAVALGGTYKGDTQRHTETITDKVSKIDISANADDINIIASDTDSIRIAYNEGKNKQYDIKQENGTLYLTPAKEGTRKWYDYININFNDELNKINIEIPEFLKPDMRLNSNYGDISLSGIGGNLTINSDCGDIDIQGGKLDNLSCEASYGDVEIENTEAKDISIIADCGDIDAERISGNIKANVKKGDIDIEYITAENITLSSELGDISCAIAGQESDYNIAAETKLGDCNVRNRTGGKYNLNVNTDMGDVEVRFLR